MGMNVSTNYGVNPYAYGSLSTGTTRGTQTSSAQGLYMSQPQYDTVSFSGNVQQPKQEDSTGKKVLKGALIIGGVALAATTVWAAVRGGKINGEGAKLIDNIKKGFGSIFTKAGRAEYASKIASLADDAAGAAAKAAKSAAGSVDDLATKCTEAKKVQKEAKAALAKLKPGDEGYEAAKKAFEDAKQNYASLTNQLGQAKKAASKAALQATLADDKTYQAMQQELDKTNTLKTKVEAQITELKTKAGTMAQQDYDTQMKRLETVLEKHTQNAAAQQTTLRRYQSAMGRFTSTNAALEKSNAVLKEAQKKGITGKELEALKQKQAQCSEAFGKAQDTIAALLK